MLHFKITMDDIIRRKKRPIIDMVQQPVGRIALKPSSPPSRKVSEPAFVPPEIMADRDIMDAAATHGREIVNEARSDKKSAWKRRFSLHMPHGKKQWIIVSVVAVLTLGAGGSSAYWFGFRKPAKAAPVAVVIAAPKKEPAPVPTTEISKLSGREVPIGTNLEPVTAIQIENSPDARPQAGLLDASIIFEAIAEGGITRFNALFQDTAPDYVGPVRSLRPYYIDWFWPFDASIAHVGGSPQALAEVRSLGIKDLDQFANSAAYSRINSRYAPHNVYTSLARLNELEKTKGFTTANFTGWDRKKEAKIAVPTAKTVNLAISSFYYNVSYSYSPETNGYLRSEGGQPHKDDKSGKQLEPKVVIAIVMGRGIASDGQHTEYTTTGSGSMYVFQDGAVQEGTWSKATRQAQWVFTDPAGKAIAFNPGQTWVTIVDSKADVTFTP